MRDDPSAATALPPARGALPIARNDAGREHIEGVVAQRRATREEIRQQKEVAKRAADVARCQQSDGFWCKLDECGDPRCNWVFPDPRKLAKHLASGQHSAGAIRPYRAGVAAGRTSARDRDVNVVTHALAAVVAPSSSIGGSGGTLQPAEDFRLEFADGYEYELAPAEVGWARGLRATGEQRRSAAHSRAT